MKSQVLIVVLALGARAGICPAVNIPIPIHNGDFETPVLIESGFNETVYFWNEQENVRTEANRSGEWMPEGFSQMLRLGITGPGAADQDLNHDWLTTDRYELRFEAYELGWFAQAGESGEALIVELRQSDGTVLWRSGQVSVDNTLAGDENAITLGPAAHDFTFLIDAADFATGTEGSTLNLRFAWAAGPGSIWVDNVALTLIATTIPDTGGELVCHWKLDETTGTVAADASGNGNNGTVNGTTFDTASQSGVNGAALEFAGNADGSDDWVTHSLTPGSWSAYTVSLWVKADGLGQTEFSGIFNNSTGSGSGFQLDVDGGSPGTYRYHGSADFNFGPVTSAWVHLAAICDGTTTRLYYNGSPAGSASVADVQFQRFELGVNRNRNQRFAGVVDDLQIYDVALSAANVMTLYQNPGSTIDVSQPSQVPVVYDFDPDDGYVLAGTTVTLRWQELGADTVTIDQGIGDVTSNTSADGIGSTTVTVNATTTFTLTAGNGQGDTTAQTTVHVGPERPNVVLFLVDDMGLQDTSVPFHYIDGVPQPTANNALYRSPSMQRLADNGILFTDCYAMPVCSPTRNCLMTGLNSFRHGTTDWIRNNGSVTHTRNHRDLDPPKNWVGTGLKSSQILLPQVLSDAGYHTIHGGKGHLGSSGSFANFPDDIGFNVNIAGEVRGSPPNRTYYNYANLPGMAHYAVVPTDNTGIHLTDATTSEVKHHVKDAVDAGRPFFLYMSHYAVHGPFVTDPRFSANYPSLSGNSLSFATMLEGMDKSLGNLLDFVDDLGQAGNTLFIFLGDNGSDNPHGGTSNSLPLRGRKGNKYEGGMRVPLLVSWAKRDPGNAFQQALSIPAASHEDDIVTVFDLFPTILGVAGIPFSHEIDGFDLSPYFRATPGTHRPQEVLIHYPHDHNSDYFTVYREGNYKLIYSYDENTINDTFDASNNDNQITPVFELYNLADDIGETTDLAQSDPARVAAMATKMGRELHTAELLWPVLEGSSDTVTPLSSYLICGNQADYDCDGIVNVTDLVLFTGAWLTCSLLPSYACL